METTKVGGQIFFDSTRKMIIVGGRRLAISENVFSVCKALVKPATFVVVCLCDGKVSSIETDTDIDSAVCVCVSEKKEEEFGYSIEMPILCPSCMEKDIESRSWLYLVDEDFDEMNMEGTLEFVCRVCKTEFTTDLIHLEVVEHARIERGVND